MVVVVNVDDVVVVLVEVVVDDVVEVVVVVPSRIDSLVRMSDIASQKIVMIASTSDFQESIVVFQDSSAETLLSNSDILSSSSVQLQGSVVVVLVSEDALDKDTNSRIDKATATKNILLIWTQAPISWMQFLNLPL